MVFLELMFILRRIPGWLKNRARRQAVRMPKLHFVDTAGSRFRHGILFYAGAEVLPFGRGGQAMYALPLRMLCGDYRAQ